MLVDTLLFLIPSLYLRDKYDYLNNGWIDIPLLLMSSGGHLIYLYWGQIALGRSKSRAFIKLPSLMMLGIQLAINNSKAGLEALLKRESEFVRTPKTGELQNEKQTPMVIPPSIMRYKAVAPKGAIFECIVAGVYAIVLMWAANHQHWFMLPFLLLLTIGFVTSAIHSFYNHYQLSR
jgi:hypothetical protein